MRHRQGRACRRVFLQSLHMTGATILVTGASGFLGTAVCHALVDSGANIIATHYRSALAFEHPSLHWIACDLTSTSAELDLLCQRFDTVFHLAAVLPSGQTAEKEAARINRHIDDLVFRTAAKKRVPVVYASGTSVYGHTRDVTPISETSRAAPSSPYPQAKLDSERAGADMALGAGTRFVALRLCAPYGPRQRARTVLQVFIERSLRGETLEYYGSGRREQAFTFESDAARAFLLAVRKGNGCYNVTGAPSITMRELALLVADVGGHSAGLVKAAAFTDPQEGLTARFNTLRASVELGWQPNVSLREGIVRCMAVRKAGATA